MAKPISADLTNNNLCILEYSTTDGIMLSINTRSFSFDANIEAHTYTDIGRIIFGTPVTKIGDKAFRDCSSLTSVTIPDSVTKIGVSAFSYCSGLTSVVIPGSVTEIGKFAFYGCSGLTSIKVADGNKIYDSRDNCNAIIETATNTLVRGCEATIIPDSVTTIEEYAFYGCSGLTSVVIPDSVTEIGKLAFYGCSGLMSVVIPDSVTTIEEYAFYGCSGLTSIKVADGNKIYDSRDNCNAIIETATNTLVCGCEATIIPDSVTKIEESAFSDCSGLTSVVIPDSVTKIGDFAFEGCRGLTSVVIPGGVTEIGDFAFSNCSGLTSVYCKPITPPTAGSSMFSDNASGRKIYVLASSIEAYKAASYWSWYKSDIEGYDF